MTSPTTPSLPDALRACIAKWRERRIGSIPRAVFEICISDVERALDEHSPAIEALLREKSAAHALIERLRNEAQIHAQEARTANATIAEIYQLCSGATGEPGNWNGAEPVRALLRERESLGPIDRDEAIDRSYIPLPGGWEVQTQGKGSSFRIANTKTGDRLLIPPSPYLHELLETMAREIHAAIAGPKP